MRFVVGKLEKEIARGYKDLWKDIPFNSFCAYITLFFCGFPSLNELVRNCACFQSVSTLSRHMKAVDSQVLNRSMRRLRGRVLKKIKIAPDDWIFAFDTTDNPKRTKGILGGGKWATSKGRIFHGRNILVLSAVNIKHGYSIPLVWFPCIKPKDDPENGKTAWELVLDSLDLLSKEGFPKRPVVGDSWFDGVPFMKSISERGFEFVIEIKSNRRAKAQGDTEFQRLPNHFSGLRKEAVFGATTVPEKVPLGLRGKKFASSMPLELRATRRKGQKDDERDSIELKVAAVFNYPNSKEAFAFYGTNSLERTSEWLWSSSRCRWNIEVMFRDLKQQLSWGKGAHKTQQSSDIAIVIPFLILGYLRLNPLDAEETPIATALEQAKLRETNFNIDFLTKNPSHHLIEKYKNRSHSFFACKKPRDNVVESIKYNPLSHYA